MRIVFQGDSITDAGRDRGNSLQLGNGYAHFAAQMLAERFPRLDLTVHNLGISGDRSIDLRNRWQADCLGLKPDILSVLVGINDIWRAFDSGDPTAAADYEANCRYLFESAKAAGAKLVVLEPFLLINAPDREDWQPDMSPKLTALRRLSRELADAYVPLDGLFAAASISRPPAYWAADGVHPTGEGAWFIARHASEAIAGLIGKE